MKNINSKLIILIATIQFFAGFKSQAQPPSYIWAKTLTGNVESIQRVILYDATGNVYISGVFFGTVDFDPGPGVANITPSPYGCNVYIAKYDANGSYLWAKNIPIVASYGGNSMALDLNGNIYITGYFSGSNLDFDPGINTNSLSSSGGNDIYFAKYDNNGNYIWAFNIGSAGDDRGSELLIDNTGNIILTGIFSQTVDFEPGIAVTNLTSVGGNEIFLAKYSTNGNLSWVKQLSGTASEDVRDLEVDNSGNIIITGLFAGSTDFDPGPGSAVLTSAGGNDIFIAKFDNSGNYIWANKFGSTNADAGSALKTDALGNIVISGIFMGTVDFDPGSVTTNLIASSNATFIGKYDANGNYLWVKKLPINFNNSDVALTFSGNIFIAGYYGNGYGSPIDMDPGSGTALLNVPTNLPPPTYNILGYLDSFGNFIWADVFGRQCYCSVMGYKSSLAVDPAGFLYYAGIFNGPWGSGTVDFDPGTGVANLIAPSSVDNVFFAKYGIMNVPLPIELISFNGEKINGVHQLTWTTGSELNNDYFEIERSPDGNNTEIIGRVEGNGNSSHQQHYFFYDENPLNGDNYYRLKQVDYDGVSSYSTTVKLTVQNNGTQISYTEGIIHIIKKGNQYSNVIINDLSGRTIQQVSFIEEHLMITLYDFSPGIYFIRFSDERDVIIKKIIIQK